MAGPCPCIADARGALTVLEGARHLAPRERPAAFDAALPHVLGER